MFHGWDYAQVLTYGERDLKQNWKIYRHPNFASQIPPNSRVVLLPGDDPELARINRESVERAMHLDDEPNRPLVFIVFDRLLPAQSRLDHLRFLNPPFVVSKV